MFGLRKPGGPASGRRPPSQTPQAGFHHPFNDFTDESILGNFRKAQTLGSPSTLEEKGCKALSPENVNKLRSTLQARVGPARLALQEAGLRTEVLEVVSVWRARRQQEATDPHTWRTGLPDPPARASYVSG